MTPSPAAGPDAWSVGVFSATTEKGAVPKNDPLPDLAYRSTSETCRGVAAPVDLQAVLRTARPTCLEDHRCRLRVPSDPGAACPFGSSPRLKPVAEFGLLFKRGPGLDQPLLSDCEANTTRSCAPLDSTLCYRCIRWKTNIRFASLAFVVCPLMPNTTS